MLKCCRKAGCIRRAGGTDSYSISVLENTAVIWATEAVGVVVKKGRRKDIPLWYTAVVREQVRNSLSMLYILGSIRKIVANEVHLHTSVKLCVAFVI